MNEKANWNNLRLELIKSFKHYLKFYLPKDSFAQVYEYAIFPPGKLFRPLLAHAVFNDFLGNEKYSQADKKNIELLSLSMELHHAYTLIHDDLPAMDNDDFRRGKPSVHKAFNQWQAILAGDGLLNLSYGILGSITTPYLSQILRYVNWSLGPKGLIQGQVYDLSHSNKNSFASLLITHKLKTARLIQASMTLSTILANKKLAPKDLFKSCKEMHQLGEHLGISFQLLDDLTELEAMKLSPHEANINPWPKNFNQTLTQLKFHIEKIEAYFKKPNHQHLVDFLDQSYFKQIKLKVTNLTIDQDVSPVVRLLERLSHLNERA